MYKIIKPLISAVAIALGFGGAVKAIPLEEQISKLDEIGLKMNAGLTVEDLLYSYDREEYESAPFDLILLAYGSDVEREPWDRAICDRVWNFDVEFIEGDGSYIEIVERFSKVAGVSDQVSDIQDLVDFENDIAWVSYKINGKQKKYNALIDDDWADPKVIKSIMDDMLRKGYRFYAIDNGQASVWLHLNESEANVLRRFNVKFLF